MFFIHRLTAAAALELAIPVVDLYHKHLIALLSVGRLALVLLAAVAIKDTNLVDGVRRLHRQAGRQAGHMSRPQCAHTLQCFFA